MNGLDFAPVALGLLSAVVWGAGDFSGGLASKRTDVYSVLIPSQIMGLALMFLAALGLHETVPPVEHLIAGAVAGLVGAIGLVALYRALSLGRMGIAAPISAVVAAVLPVVVSVFVLGLPSLVHTVGFGIALISVWLVSRTDHARITLRDLGLPFVAGAGFGLFFVIISRANSVSVLFPLVAARCASIIMFLVFTTARRLPRFPPMQHLPLILLAGILDAGGNIFFVAAARVGRLDIAAVLSSLYPAATILLARFILHEKFSRPQIVGIILALAAIVLISL